MKNNGFALFELLFCLVLSSILLFCAVTSWAFLKEKNELNSLLNDIASAVRYAKLRALSEGQLLVISSNDWSEGMQLIRRSGKTKEESLIHQWRWNLVYWTVQWRGANGSNLMPISGTTTSAMNNGQFSFVHESVY